MELGRRAGGAAIDLSGVPSVDPERAVDLGLGPRHGDDPEAELDVGADLDVEGEGGALGGLPPESGGGDASDERGVAGELRVERAGLPGALEEVGQAGVSERLALVVGARGDVEVVEGDAPVGVVELDGEGEVVAEDPRPRGEREGGEVGGDGGGADDVGAEEEVEDEGDEAGGEDDAGGDAEEAAQHAAEEAPAGAAQQRRHRAGGLAHCRSIDISMDRLAAAAVAGRRRRRPVPY